jgi:dTDP-4-dehydrorhamnose 3,5-epimerase-like enzyme
MTEKEDAVRLIEGNLAVDDRGAVGFVNGFDFQGVKRFYFSYTNKAGFVRAWHAHRRESKYITVLRGAAVVGAVKVDNWEKPSRQAPVGRYVLSAQKPAVLYIPAGYANGVMSLTDDTVIVFFSTATIEETRQDDVRYDARYWDIWQIAER